MNNKMYSDKPHKLGIKDGDFIGFRDASLPILPAPKQHIKRKSNLNDFRYKVITKDAYIEYRLNETERYGINKRTVDKIMKSWDKLRKGYNFVIAVGKDEYAMFYSIEYFNEHVLGRG